MKRKNFKLDNLAKYSKDKAEKLKKHQTIRTDHWNEDTQLAVRIAALFLPLAIITYGFLVRFNILQIAHNPTHGAMGNLDLYIISFLLVCMAVWQFIWPVHSKLSILIEVISYNLLTGLFFAFVGGINTPLIIVWIQLMTLSYTYFFERGIYLSTLTLMLVVFMNVFVWQTPTAATITYGVIIVIIFYYIASFFIKSSQTNEVERKDLTTAKIQESLQRDRVLTIVNNLADAVLSTNMEGIVQVYNAASLNLLDTNKSPDGHFIDEVIPLSDSNDKHVSVFKEFQSIKTVVKRDDLSFSFADGEKIRIEATFSPIRSNFSRAAEGETHDGYIIILRDITKAKSLEEERDEFISVTSHELRTPITIAEGTISNVQIMMDHPDITPVMLKDAVNIAHDQIMFLANMVNDLSALSRAERDTEEDSEDIDIKELVHKLVDKYTDEAKAKKLQLDLDLAPKIGKIHNNRLHLEELLQNLITNALKYTKRGGITIIADQKADKITISVKDTGIGIGKTDQGKLFAKFYRSEDYRTRETGGTGLGLYVAAKLAHKLGTKIQLTSRLNVGSTFSITLKEKKDN